MIKFNDVNVKLLMYSIKRILDALINFEMQEEVFLNVCFELLIFIGPTALTVDQLRILVSLVCEENMDKMRPKVFKALFR